MSIPHNISLRLFQVFLVFSLWTGIYGNGVAQQLVQVPKYGLLELSFQAQVTVENPFTNYLLKVKLTAPDGTIRLVDGFFDGDGRGGQQGNIWKARICPDQPGVWSWELAAGDVEDPSLIGQRGSFECIDTGLPGGIQAKGRYFYLQSGRPVYLQGNFLDFSDDLQTTHVFMSEQISDRMRERILRRQLQQKVNKINIYFANQGDYRGIKVWPWLGDDLLRMNLRSWTAFDEYIRMIESAGLLAELWFFADDSGFGKLAQTEKNHLFRYAMARTSAFSHAFYIIALEWQEGWSLESIRRSGSYIQLHNPWKRLLSVHSLPARKPDSIRSYISCMIENLSGEMKYADEPWADFIASQAGNAATPRVVNCLAVEFARREQIPHLSEEFGILKKDQDRRLMRNMWANLLGGAAGGGTGSNIAALMNFIESTKLPFQRLQPANDLCKDGGNGVFCAAEAGQHYLVYSMGVDIKLDINGANYLGYWYDPLMVGSLMTATMSDNGVFSLPDKDRDWVLWLTRKEK